MHAHAQLVCESLRACMMCVMCLVLPSLAVALVVAGRTGTRMLQDEMQDISRVRKTLRHYSSPFLCLFLLSCLPNPHHETTDSGWECTGIPTSVHAHVHVHA